MATPLYVFCAADDGVVAGRAQLSNGSAPSSTFSSCRADDVPASAAREGEEPLSRARIELTFQVTTAIDMRRWCLFSRAQRQRRNRHDAHGDQHERRTQGHRPYSQAIRAGRAFLFTGGQNRRSTPATGEIVAGDVRCRRRRVAR